MLRFCSWGTKKKHHQLKGEKQLHSRGAASYISTSRKISESPSCGPKLLWETWALPGLWPMKWGPRPLSPGTPWEQWMGMEWLECHCDHCGKNLPGSGIFALPVSCHNWLSEAPACQVTSRGEGWAEESKCRWRKPPKWYHVFTALLKEEKRKAICFTFLILKLSDHCKAELEGHSNKRKFVCCLECGIKRERKTSYSDICHI